MSFLSFISKSGWKGRFLNPSKVLSFQYVFAFKDNDCVEDSYKKLGIGNEIMEFFQAIFLQQVY